MTRKTRPPVRSVAAPVELEGTADGFSVQLCGRGGPALGYRFAHAGSTSALFAEDARGPLVAIVHSCYILSPGQVIPHRRPAKDTSPPRPRVT